MATTATDAELDRQHAEAIAENARRDEIAKPVDLDDIRDKWSDHIEAAYETGSDNACVEAERYRSAHLVLDAYDHAPEAAAEFQRIGAFMLARAAELAGR